MCKHARPGRRPPAFRTWHSPLTHLFQAHNPGEPLSTNVFCAQIRTSPCLQYLAQSTHPSHPGPPQSRSALSCPLLPAPAQPDPLSSTDFSPQNSFPPWTYPFFPVIYRIFPSRRGKNLITSQKLGGKAKFPTAVKRCLGPKYQPLCTAQNNVPWSIVAQQLSANT